MASHMKKGRQGEQLAASYLEKRGYQILHRNWRHSRYEIDLIALKEDRLHFVEVKLRRSALYGHPEAAVDRRKFSCLLQAADAFLHLHPCYPQVQYDILAITLTDNQPDILLIEDVYIN